MTRYEVVVMGSGLAGLTVALNLADQRKVAIVTKGEVLDGASNWAQGGIAAVLASDDSPQSHISDTLVAGAGLCDPDITRYVVEHGREAAHALGCVDAPPCFEMDDDPVSFVRLLRHASPPFPIEPYDSRAVKLASRRQGEGSWRPTGCAVPRLDLG